MLHSYTTIPPIAQTHNSSVPLDPRSTPNPKIHIHNLQIHSVQHFQLDIFLYSSNQLKHSIKLSSSSCLIQQHFSLCFWGTQPNLASIHSENYCKDPFPSRSLGEHIAVSTALNNFSCNICYLPRPFLTYHHCTYCPLVTVRKPALVCSHLKLGQFLWNIKLKRPLDHTIRFVYYFVLG